MQAIPPQVLALLNPIEHVGPDLTAPCPEQLPPALDASLAGLGGNHRLSAAIYHDCRDRHYQLAEAARAREAEEARRIERARKALEDR